MGLNVRPASTWGWFTSIYIKYEQDESQYLSYRLGCPPAQ